MNERIPDSMEPNQPSAPLSCKQCGEAMSEVESGDFDEVGPHRVELECPNGHRIVIERVEIYDDDTDLDVS